MKDEKNTIAKVLESALCSMKEVLDGNSVMGKPVALADGTYVTPISKITLAYLTGGGEYGTKDGMSEYLTSSLPLLAGNGGFIQLTPIGFLTAKGEGVKLIPAEKEESALEKVVKILADNLSKESKSK